MSLQSLASSPGKQIGSGSFGSKGNIPLVRSDSDAKNSSPIRSPRASPNRVTARYLENLSKDFTPSELASPLSRPLPHPLSPVPHRKLNTPTGSPRGSQSGKLGSTTATPSPEKPGPPAWKLSPTRSTPGGENEKKPRASPLKSPLKSPVRLTRSDINHNNHNNHNNHENGKSLRFPATPPASSGTGDAASRAPKASVSELKAGKPVAHTVASENRAVSAAEAPLSATAYTSMKGRRRLLVDDPTATAHLDTYIDRKRDDLQAYEYLCRVGEAKQWIEQCIGEPMPPVTEFEAALGSGVILAKLTRRFAPHLVKKIYESSKHKFFQSENINYFFAFLDEVGIPDLFRFELTDLYERKNIPKVIFCIHALSFILSADSLAPEMDDLVGKLEFSEEELRRKQQDLDGAKTEQHQQLPAAPEETSEKLETSEPQEQQEPQKNTEKPVQTVSDAAVVSPSKTRSPPQTEKPADALKQVEILFTDSPAAVEPNVAETPESFQTQQNLQTLQTLHFPQFSPLSAETSPLKLPRAGLQTDSMRTLQPPGSDCLDSPYTPPAPLFSAQPLSPETEPLFQPLPTENRPNSLALDPAMSLADRTLAEHEAELLPAKLRTAQQLLDATDSVIRLQAAARGWLLRLDLLVISVRLNDEAARIAQLQAVVRARKPRTAFLQTVSRLSEVEREVSSLQSAARAQLTRKAFRMRRDMLAEKPVVLSVTALQARIRAGRIRQTCQTAYGTISPFAVPIRELQSIARGALCRTRLNYVLDYIDYFAGNTYELQLVARGALVRRRIARLQAELGSNQVLNSVVAVQSAVRGLLARDGYLCLREEFAEACDDIIRTQAAVRGYLVRKQHRDRMAYFAEHLPAIVKLQSYFRRKVQGDAYRILISDRRAPFAVVKRFAALLDDSDVDWAEERRLEASRRQISEAVKRIDKLEKFIAELDVKIALLMRNQITLDELVAYRAASVPNGVSGTSGGVPSRAAGPGVLGDSVASSLSRGARQKLELLQGLLYVLQTQPAYFARLFTLIEAEALSDQEMATAAATVLEVFDRAGANANVSAAAPPSESEIAHLPFEQRREEFFFLQLLGRAVADSVSRAVDLRSFVARDALWKRLLGMFCWFPRERRFLRTLFGPTVTMVNSIPGLDLESDPLVIFRRLAEVSGSGLAVPSGDLTGEEVIQLPEVRTRFVQNLQRLRELATEFLKDLEARASDLPYHIRFLAREAFRAGKVRFPDAANNRKAVAAALHVVVAQYLVPLLLRCEDFGVPLAPEQSAGTDATDHSASYFAAYDSAVAVKQRNLQQIARLLSQMAALRPFGSADVYLQPLNEFLRSCCPRMIRLCHSIVDPTGDLAAVYGISVLDDLRSAGKPVLHLSTSDVARVYGWCVRYAEQIGSGQSGADSLSEVTAALRANSGSSGVGGDAELAEIAEAVGYGGTIKLDLNARFCRVEDPELEVNALLLETKRGLVYEMRVQPECRSVLELLVSEVREEHEAAYWTLLEAERGAGRGAAAGLAGRVGEAGSLPESYVELKRQTLERILLLEANGNSHVNRADGFQLLLDGIAADIRTKHERRLSRAKQLELVTETRKALEIKEQYLESQLKAYNGYIEKSLEALQSSTIHRRKRKPVLPFTRQYFHLRELQKSGRMPRFGSYKYSASQLRDKGILVEVNTGIGINDHGSLAKMHFAFASDQVGVFLVNAYSGSVTIPGGSMTVTLDELLRSQHDGQQLFECFDGRVKFDTNMLVAFILRKFYR